MPRMMVLAGVRIRKKLLDDGSSLPNGTKPGPFQRQLWFSVLAANSITGSGEFHVFEDNPGWTDHKSVSPVVVSFKLPAIISPALAYFRIFTFVWNASAALRPTRFFYLLPSCKYSCRPASYGIDTNESQRTDEQVVHDFESQSRQGFFVIGLAQDNFVGTGLTLQSPEYPAEGR